jgi:hypothetical protein
VPHLVMAALFNRNPDCTAADVIVAKVTKQGKGQVEFEESLGYSAYPENSQTGFKGTDSFEI